MLDQRSEQKPEREATQQFAENSRAYNSFMLNTVGEDWLLSFYM